MLLCSAYQVRAIPSRGVLSAPPHLLHPIPPASRTFYNQPLVRRADGGKMAKHTTTSWRFTEIGVDLEKKLTLSNEAIECLPIQSQKI